MQPKYKHNTTKIQSKYNYNAIKIQLKYNQNTTTMYSEFLHIPSSNSIQTHKIIELIFIKFRMVVTNKSLELLNKIFKIIMSS